MDARLYLPSPRFSGIVVSIALAGGLIVGAQYLTSPKTASTSVLLTASGAPQTENWQASLDAIQAQAPGLPAAPDQTAVQAMLTAAQSSNVTNSIARSLFVNLGDAGAQGLGSDLPTQEKLIADATAQVQKNVSAAYTASNLTMISQTPTSLHEWGNGVMKTFLGNPRANNDEALLAIGRATDYGDASALAPLTAIGAAYAALADDLASTPVPSTVAPLYLQLLNNLSKMSVAAGEMKTVVDDPMRGLAGLQLFQTSGAEASRLLTTLAEQLRKSGILFSKDEPGAAWDVFLPLYSPQ